MVGLSAFRRMKQTNRHELKAILFYRVIGWVELGSWGAHGLRLKSSVCIVETVAINSPIYMRKHIGCLLSLHNAAYYLGTGGK